VSAISVSSIVAEYHHLPRFITGVAVRKRPLGFGCASNYVKQTGSGNAFDSFALISFTVT
jgi:hypothetical protein